MALLIDTGSPVSILRGDLWDKSEQSGKKLNPWTGNPLVGVNGVPLAIRGCVLVEIKLLQERFQHQVLIVDSLMTEGILGMDFLNDNHCSIDLPQGLLRLPHGVDVPMQKSQREHSKVKVELVSTIQVPARSELDVLARIPVPVMDGETWLLEGTQRGSSPVLVARAVVSPQSQSVVVHILNPHSEDATLFQDTKVAELTELDPLCIVANQDGPVEKSHEVSEKKRQMLWDIVEDCGPELSDEERTEFFEVLLTHAHTFAESSTDIGRTDILKHTIDTGSSHPIRQAARRVPPVRKGEVSKLLQEMLEKDVIQRSKSPWASPIVLVQKKDGTTRFCVDYRKLNGVTRKDAYPLPRIDDTLDMLHGSKWFSTLDLASGYWQVEMAPEDQQRTAFSTADGLFEFKVMPFGFVMPPPHFRD